MKNMAGNTPSNPSKAPSVPTGPKASAKGSPSKVMSPMPKAGKTSMKNIPPKGKRTVSPKSQNQTVQGGPKR